MRRSITIILSIHIHFFSNYRYSLSQIHAFNFVPQVHLRGRGHRPDDSCDGDDMERFASLCDQIDEFDNQWELSDA